MTVTENKRICDYLRRFETRDRDGNYWSPQEILDAADLIERLEAENAKLRADRTGDAEEIHAKDDRIKELEVQNVVLRDRYSTPCSLLKDVLESVELVGFDVDGVARVHIDRDWYYEARKAVSDE